MSKLDLLAIGPHPDDVELGCGGTLALAARQGRRVGILPLTRGESGTRGTAALRQAEAERAAAALGAAELAFLDCGDGALRNGRPEEDALIDVLRAWRPELVLSPAPRDRHPDHGRGHELAAAAAYYSGLAARGGRGSAPHRPAAVFSYMQHNSFEPSFVVDVTAVWDVKMQALAAYPSQIYQTGLAGRAGQPDQSGQPGQPDQPGQPGQPHRPAQPGPPGQPAAPNAEPVTKVSSRQFRLAVEGRARHFGQLIGAELGEPFWSPLQLAVADLFALQPGGVR